MRMTVWGLGEEKVWRTVVRDSAQCEMAAKVMGFHAWKTGHSCFRLSPDLDLCSEHKLSLSNPNYNETIQKNSPFFTIFCEKSTPLSSTMCCFLFHPKAPLLCSTLLCFTFSELIQWTKMRWDTTSPEQNHWLKLKQKKKKDPHASRLLFPAQVNNSSFIKLIRLCFCAEPCQCLFKKLSEFYLILLQTWFWSHFSMKVWQITNLQQEPCWTGKDNSGIL